MNLVEVATTKPYRVRIGSGAVHELAGLVAGRRAAVVCHRLWCIWYLALVLTILWSSRFPTLRPPKRLKFSLMAGAG